MIQETEELSFFILKISESNLANILLYLQWVLDLTPGFQTMTFSRLMKYFKQQKWRKRIDLKHYELEKNIWNYVGKYKTTRKKKRRDFYGRTKNILAKNNSTPADSTLAFSKTSLLNNTTKKYRSYINVSWQSNSITLLDKYYKN